MCPGLHEKKLLFGAPSQGSLVNGAEYGNLGNLLNKILGPGRSDIHYNIFYGLGKPRLVSPPTEVQEDL